MRQNINKIFRCRVTRVKGRNSIFINFREAFWEKVKPSHQNSFRPQSFINRVYFFEENNKLFISFKDPIYLPMYKVYIRRLQSTDCYKSFKVTIPIQLVKKYGLKNYNIVSLYRLKNQSGLVHTCTFEHDKRFDKSPIERKVNHGIDVELIDLLR